MLNFSHDGLQSSQLIVNAALDVKDVGTLKTCAFFVLMFVSSAQFV